MTGVEPLTYQDMTSEEVQHQIKVGTQITTNKVAGIMDLLNKDIHLKVVEIMELNKVIHLKVVGTMGLNKVIHPKVVVGMEINKVIHFKVNRVIHQGKIMVLQVKERGCRWITTIIRKTGGGFQGNYNQGHQGGYYPLDQRKSPQGAEGDFRQQAQNFSPGTQGQGADTGGYRQGYAAEGQSFSQMDQRNMHGENAPYQPTMGQTGTNQVRCLNI